MNETVLLDVSRSAGRRWTGACPSGIDRVSDAYCRHFADKARAVLQLRGRSVILGKAESAEFFGNLDAQQKAFRRMLTRLIANTAGSGARDIPEGSLYLNPGHSDFDLPSHARWTWRRRVRGVYLLHDLIPVSYPDFTLPNKVKRHRGRVMHALNNGAGIIVNSAATADELRQFARRNGIAVPSVHVGHIGTERITRTSPSKDVVPPHFLALGTIEARKNHALLLRVWARLIERMGADTPRLVCAGKWGVKADEVRWLLQCNPALSRHVEFRSGLDDGEIASLMAGSRALLIPSLAEGFGLPLVEALEAGVPVIANDLPVFREIGQGIPLLIDAGKDDLWLEHIGQFVKDGPARRRQLSAMGGFHPPRWQHHFAALEDWLAKLAHSAGACQHGSRPSHLHIAAEGPNLSDIDRKRSA
ncbi:glycosyltransferase family 4 protein [Aurantiacibacter poecillastricola]|uniref:glycosyltransferase family 4 protein n=1 Tax=Aurantiacibacter poecillastricola TaxID=3064385 RepID=UPI00273EBE89|nr:glycosyltransferase family 1 protein [Aurantiacibacter sp. 219JJ12-13]MDP5261361.1 glycosyltransferase family 1 protein [Aurantiacibacter sp. 219JJ12-13]